MFDIFEIEPEEPTYLNETEVEFLLSELKLTENAGALALEYYTITPDNVDSDEPFVAFQLMEDLYNSLPENYSNLNSSEVLQVMNTFAKQSVVS